MLRKFFLFILISVAIVAPAAAAPETIVTHEVEKYFYKDGQMEKYEGQYENTYLLDLEKNTLVRTRIYDYQNKKIIPDDTVYVIQKDLNSSPTNAVRFNLPVSLRAYGQPDADSAELLTITEGFSHSIKATGTNLVISRAKRLK